MTALGLLPRCWALLLAAAAVGCANQDLQRVRSIAARRLACPEDEVDTELEDDSATIRVWIAGCNSRMIHVWCTNRGCDPALEPIPDQAP